MLWFNSDQSTTLNFENEMDSLGNSSANLAVLGPFLICLDITDHLFHFSPDVAHG